MADSLTGQLLLTADQANAETTANEFLLAVEQLGALKIITMALATPAALTPSDFDAYIVATSPAGDWSTYTAGDVAFYYQGWIRIKKKDGMTGFLNSTDETEKPRRGMIAYSADQDKWFNLSSPIWYSTGASYFTGRYTNDDYNTSGTVDYPIYARVYHAALSGTTTNIAHGLNAELQYLSNYMWVSHGLVKLTVPGSLAAVKIYKIPDSQVTAIEVTETNIVVTANTITSGTYSVLLYLEYAKA